MKGVLFLEAAVLIPAMILAGLGYLSIVDYLAERTAINNAAHAVAMALQADPKMNATELYEVVRASGSSTTPFVQKKSGTTFNASCNPSECKIDGLTARVVAKATMPNDSDFSDTTKLDNKDTDHANWTNPHLADNSHSGGGGGQFGAKLHNDSSPYFVGVRLEWTPKLPFIPFNLGRLAAIKRTVVIPVKDRDYSPTSLRFEVQGRSRWNNLINSYCEQLPNGSANPKCGKAEERCGIRAYPNADAKTRREKISDDFREIRSRPGCLRRACRGAFPGRQVVSAYRISSCNVFQGAGAYDHRDGITGTRTKCPQYKIAMKVQCFFTDTPISQQSWQNLVPATIDE